MADKSFNLEIDAYIEKRRKRKYKPVVRRKNIPLSTEGTLTKEERTHLELSTKDKAVIIKKRPWYARFFNIKPKETVEDKFEEELTDELVEDLEEIDEIEEQEQELEEKKQNIIKRMWKALLRKPENEITEEIEEIEEPPKVDPDLIRVLYIADELLAKLPREEKLKFMETDDFLLYKSVFKRYRIKELGK